MSYQTTFCLVIDCTNIEKLNDMLRTLKVYSGVEVSNSTEFTTEWLTHHQDLMKLSEAFPDNLMMLYGNGQDEADQWRKFYYQGHSVRKSCYVSLENLGIS